MQEHPETEPDGYSATAETADGTAPFKAIADRHARYPELPLRMTELCHAYEAGTPKRMKLPRTDFDDGEFWGQQIFSDLEVGASAWIFWCRSRSNHFRRLTFFAG